VRGSIQTYRSASAPSMARGCGSPDERSDIRDFDVCGRRSRMSLRSCGLRTLLASPDGSADRINAVQNGIEMIFDGGGAAARLAAQRRLVLDDEHAAPRRRKRPPAWTRQVAKAGTFPLETMPPTAPSLPTTPTSTAGLCSSTQTLKAAMAGPQGNQVSTTFSPACCRTVLAGRSVATKCGASRRRSSSRSLASRAFSRRSVE
jgi:hypothetical protein